MADPVENFEGLGKLAKRVVRGAMPGNKNNPAAGTLYVTTGAGAAESLSDFIDTHPLVPESLLRSLLNSQTQMQTPASISGDIVTASVIGAFATVEVGDALRPYPKGGLFYKVALKISSTQLKLTQPFSSFAGGPNYTGDIQVYKGSFGRALLWLYENKGGSFSDQFLFNQDTGFWQRLEESGFAPFATGASPTSRILLQNGMYLNYFSTDPAALDINVIGALDKFLPLTASDVNSVTFSPVPDPSDLSEPPNVAPITIMYKLPGQVGYSERVLGETALLSYTINPVYDGYRPLPGKNATTTLHFLENFTTSMLTPSAGTFPAFLPDGTGGFLSNLHAPSLSMTSGALTLEQGRDFDIDPLSGAFTLQEHVADESLVHAVLYPVDKAQAGMEVHVAEVPLLDAPSFDFSGALRLTGGGVDYTVNELNGGFLVLRPMSPEETLKVDFLVRGGSTSQALVVEDASDLRLNHFPVVQGTVSISAFWDGDGTQLDLKKTLVEGEDFKIYYENGVIELLEQVPVSQLKSITVTYMPALPVTVYAQVIPDAGGTQFKFLVPEGTALVKDSTSIDLVVTPEGSLLYAIRDIKDKLIFENSEGPPVGIPKFPTVFRLPSTARAIPSDTKFVWVTYSYEGTALPYAPLVSIREELPAGSLSLPFAGPADVPLIESGTLVQVTSEVDPTLNFRALAAGPASLEGINYHIPLQEAIPFSVVSPSVWVSDVPIEWVSDHSGLSISAFGQGASEIIFSGLSKVLPGILLNISEYGILQVSATRIESGITIATLSSPAPRSLLTGTTAFSLSEGLVFREGESLLAPSRGFAQESYPALQIHNPTGTGPLSGIPVRVDFTTEPGTLDITLYRKDREELKQSFTLTSSKTIPTLMQEVLSYLSSQNVTLTYESLVDEPLATEALLRYASSDMLPLPKTFNPTQAPCTFRVKPVLYRKEGESAEVKQEIQVLNGFVSIQPALQKNTRLYLSYAGNRNDLGITVETSGKRFVAIPKGTSLRVIYDYDAPDQHLVLSQQEKDYLNGWVLPYLEAQEKAMKGPQTQGSAGPELPPTTGVAQGGLDNSFVRLRDMYLSSLLLWKISEYYRNRISSFSSEAGPLRGVFLGNDDILASRQRSLTDVLYQAHFGFSRFFPDWFKSNLPQEDGRFGQEYLAYDTIHAYNSGGVGYASGNNSHFLSRELVAGDKIRFDDYSGEYTILAVSENLITFTSMITGAPPTPSQELRGSSFTVLRNNPYTKLSYLDDRGCAGAVTYSGRESAFRFDSSSSITFTVEKSEDYGATWTPVSVELLESQPSLFPVRISISDMADLLLGDPNFRSNGFYASVEEVYERPGLEVELEKAFQTRWPLPVPNTGSTPYKRNALCIRTQTGGAWFRIPSTGNTLGFLSDTIYKAGSTSIGAVRAAQQEITSRDTERNTLLPLFSALNKLDWITSLGAIAPLVTSNKNNALVHYTLLASARSGAQSLQSETDATEKTQSTYSQAGSAISTYTNFLGTTFTNFAEDSLFEGNVTGASKESFILDAHQATVPRNEMNSLLSIAFNTGGRTVLLESDRAPEVDPRILYGDKTLNPSVAIGVGGSSIAVFPSYLNNGSYQGAFTPNPFGEWVGITPTIPHSPTSSFGFTMFEAISVLATTSGVTITGTEETLVIAQGVSSWVFTYAGYGSLQSLVAGINTTGVTSASVVHPNPSESYGVLTPFPTKVLGQIAPLAIPFGFKGDLQYWVISNQNVQTRVGQLEPRSAELPSYITWYEARLLQLQTSFGTEGEKLAENRELWLRRLLNKKYGPALQILPQKRVIIDE